MNARLACKFVSIITFWFCLLLFIPAAIDLKTNFHNSIVFVAVSLVGIIFSTFFICLFLKEDFSTISIKEGFLITNLIWFVSIAIGVAIYSQIQHPLTLIDAIFESVSGFTTCGASIIDDPQIYSDGVLLFRSLTQYLGGVGFVVIAMIILPSLRIGGMQLFQTESSEHSDKLFPSLRELAWSIMKVYFGLTILLFILLKYYGLNTIDALSHTMTTVSTGGFSNYPESIAHFKSWKIEFIISIFMLLCSLPFVNYIGFIKNKKLSHNFADEQIVCFLLLLFGAFILTTWFNYQINNIEPLHATRISWFNIVSIITTTGHASDRYYLWGNFSTVLFLTLAIIGGCTGSTSGGIKIFRINIIWQGIISSIKQLIYPRQVIRITYNKQPVSELIIRDCLVFACLHFITLIIAIIFMSLDNIDLLTNVYAAIAALSNAGFSIENVMTQQSYQALPTLSKTICIILMYLGRLEFFTFLVMLNRHFWK